MLRQRIRLPMPSGASGRQISRLIHPLSTKRQPSATFTTTTPTSLGSRNTSLSAPSSLPGRAQSPTSLYVKSSTSNSSRLFSSTSSVGGNFPFKLHDIGEGIAEVELLKWHVEVGQTVDEFDVLCEVQSDKSTVELTSPVIGVVKRLGADEGLVVKVGELICDIETESVPADEEPSYRPPGENTNPPAEDEHQSSNTRDEVESRKAKTESQQDSSYSLGHSLQNEGQEKRQQDENSNSDSSLFASRDTTLDMANSGAQFSGEAAMLPSAPPPRRPHHHDTSSQQSVPERKEGKSWGELKRIVKASPAVRTLAARMDVDLGSVRGTGDGGRVTGDDVRLHAGTGTGTSSGSGSVGGRQTVKETARESVEKSTRVEFGRTRKVMYRAMGDMGQVPHFGYSHTLNLTPLLPYMKALNPPPQPAGKRPYIANDIPPSLSRDPLPEMGGREKTTILTFLIKGLLMAMEEHPIMRSRAKESAGERWLEVARDPTIAVAVSDPKFGLLTPSLPPLSPSTQLSALTSHLSNLRQNASKPTSPGSITISSVGSLGESRGAMPVLPPGGGVAICAVGRASWGMEWKATRKEKRGVWDWTPAEVEEGGMEAVLRCPVGWGGDHRVLEGAELIAFTETWKKYIEEPWRWIKVDG